MAKNKNHASQNPPTPERLDLHQIPQALITPDIERRLAALEKSSNDITNRVLDGHKWFVTIIFSALVIVLGIYGIIFKSDVRDTIDQMEKRVDRSTSEMEKKVQALVGDALKKPLLVAVTDNGGPLSNSTNHISDRGFPQLYTVFLKNIGDKRTEPLSIRYSFEKGVEQNGGFNDWEQAPPNQKDFAVSFSSKRTAITVAPDQTINVPSLPLSPSFTTPIQCELEVFYGGQEQLKIRFFIAH